MLYGPSHHLLPVSPFTLLVSFMTVTERGTANNNSHVVGTHDLYRHLYLLHQLLLLPTVTNWRVVQST